MEKTVTSGWGPTWVRPTVRSRFRALPLLTPTFRRLTPHYIAQPPQPPPPPTTSIFRVVAKHHTSIMRADIASLAIALGLVCCASAAPTFSCFDPPDEGQTNPLGEGMEDVVGAECCEALVDESDIEAERLVVWDPVNCNHGPGEIPISEAPLCRAHDTDGCRFCRQTCANFEGLCIRCSDIQRNTFAATDSPTASPFLFSSLDTPVPAGIMAVTPAPTIDPNNAGDGEGIEVGGGGDLVDECGCQEGLTDTEAEVLATRGKAMVCDPTCTDGSDLIWGVMNCNYFALGQECRACSDICEDSGDGVWLDQDEAFCKPCSAIEP